MPEAKFIEISVSSSDKIFLNVNSISRIQKRNGGAFITLLELDKGDAASFFTTIEYEELKKLIQG